MSTYLSSSRYKIASGTDSTGTVVSTRKPIYGTNYYMYTAKEKDSFDLISMRVLGTPDYWWKVADLNPHIPFPDQIPAGTRIRIPKP